MTEERFPFLEEEPVSRLTQKERLERTRRRRRKNIVPVRPREPRLEEFLQPWEMRKPLKEEWAIPPDFIIPPLTRPTTQKEIRWLQTSAMGLTAPQLKTMTEEAILQRPKDIIEEHRGTARNLFELGYLPQFKTAREAEEALIRHEVAEWRLQQFFKAEGIPTEFWPAVHPISEKIYPLGEPTRDLEAPPPVDLTKLTPILERLYPEMLEESPEVILQTLTGWAEEDPEEFIEDLLSRGTREDAEDFLIDLGATPEDVLEIIEPITPQFAVPNWLTLDFWKEALFKPYAGEDLTSKAYFSFVAGIGDVISVSGGTARWLGYEEVGGVLSAIGSTIQQVAPPDTTGEFEMADLLDPEFYATKIVRTIPFALSLAPMAIGGFYGGTGIATALGLGRVGAWLIGGFAGAALSRPLESALEAGGQYDDAIARNKTEAEARAEADEVFKDNMLLMGADAWQIAIALAPTPKWIPSSLVRAGLVRVARIGTKMVIVGLTQGGEEVYQDWRSRHARGEEWQLDPIAKEVFAIGMVMGLGMGLGGDVVVGLADRVKPKMPAPVKADFDTAVSDFEAEGFRTDQSELRALDTISQTPEGEKVVTETLKDLRGEVPIVPEDVEGIPSVFVGVEEEATKAREGQIPWEGIPSEERLQAEFDTRKLDQVTIDNVRDARVTHPITGKEVPAGVVVDINGNTRIVMNKELIKELDLVELINSDPHLKGFVRPDDFKNSKETFTEFLLEHEKQHLFIREEGFFYSSELEERLVNKRAFEVIALLPPVVEVKPPIPGAPEAQARLIELDARAKDLTREIEGALLRQEDEKATSLRDEVQGIISEMQLLERQLKRIPGRLVVEDLIGKLKELGVWLEAPPVVKKVEPEVPEVIGEGGVPVPPEEAIPQGVVENIPTIRDIGAKEAIARPARKVFERMGIGQIFKGIQKAEVLIGEERVARQKANREIMKLVDKDRWSLIFDEVNEKGSVIGLTFNEKRAVNYIRNWADEWADRKNLPKEKRIKDYIPHLFEQEMIAQLKETDKLPPELAMMLSDKVAKKITDPFLKERLGAVGFLKDPFRAMEAYDAAALRVVYYEPFLQKIAAIGNDINTPLAVRDYLKDYSRRMTGEPSKWDLKINADIQEFASKLRGFPGGERLATFLERGNVSGLVAYQYTGVIYTLWLGFKATSALRNLSQHTLIIGEVGPVHFAKGLGMRFTKEGKAVLAESLVLRSRRAAFLPGIDDSFAEKWTDKFRETALWAFRMADKQNVSDAFLAGYSEAKNLLPEADRKVWIDRGDEVAADTQYLYTKMNSMAISQSSVGRVFSILTTWSENWIELMTKWVSKRPSVVFTDYEKATGVKVKKSPWAESYKAIGIYMVIIGLGYLIKDYTRVKAWEYTGITSIRYLADVVGGDFPGLQGPGAIADMVAGFVTDDERRLKQGWNDFKSTFTPGIVRQLDAVLSGDKDWLTLFFYLEGLNWKQKKLKDSWKKDFKPYEELAPKDRKEYRENNPKIEAKMFVVNRFTALSSDEAREEVLRLIEKHNLDTEMIKGYEKVFGVDTAEELKKFQGRLGNLEKLEVGVEAEYFTVGDLVSEINKAVKTQGRFRIERDASPFVIEIIRAQDSFVQYDSNDSDGRKLYRQQFPDVEAWLYLTGRISTFENPNSAVELLRLMEKYDIPPEAIKAFVDNPEKWDALQAPLFQLELKWNDLLIEYEDADKEGRELMLEENPEFRDARRQIEAINKGIPENLVMSYVEYYAMDIVGWEQERFLKENEEYYNDVWLGILGNEPKDFEKIPSIEFEKAMNEYEALKTTGERQAYLEQNEWFRKEKLKQEAYSLGIGEFDSRSIGMSALNSAIATLKRGRASHEKFPVSKEWDAQWMANYDRMIKILGDAKVGIWSMSAYFEARNALLEDIKLDRAAAKRYEEAGDTKKAEIYREFVVELEKVRESFSAIFDIGLARDRLVAEYVEYYEIPSAGYANERYLMEHKEFYRYMVDSGEWFEKDFSKVPSKKFEEALVEYEKLSLGRERYIYRGENKWFDEEGVRIGRWKPWQGSKVKPKAKVEPIPKRTRREALEEIERKLKELIE